MISYDEDIVFFLILKHIDILVNDITLLKSNPLTNSMFIFDNKILRILLHPHPLNDTKMILVRKCIEIFNIYSLII
jgi:hypothetical protein